MLCVDLAEARTLWTREMKTLHNATFSPDGKLIATAEWEHGANLYDAATGKGLGTVPLAPSSQNERPTQVGFLPDGRLVVLTNLSFQKVWPPGPTGQGGGATPGLFSRLILWDPVARKEVRQATENVLFEGGSYAWTQLMGSGCMMQTLIEWSENGRSTRKTVRYTDPATGKATTAVELHKDDDSRFDFSPDGKTLLVMTVGRPPRLLDVTTGKTTATLDGHLRFVTAGAFSADGKLVATVSGTELSGYALAKLWPNSPPDGPAELVLWDARTGKPLVRYVYPTSEYDFNWVRFSPDGKYVVARTTDRRLVAWGRFPFRRPAIDERVGLPRLPEPTAAPPAGRPVWPASVPPARAGLVSESLDKLAETLPKSGRPSEQQVDALFLAALGRLPTDAERKRVLALVGEKPTTEKLRTVLEALTAMPEFDAHVKSLQRQLPGHGGFGSPPGPFAPPSNYPRPKD
jgi:dipeptidyl aminopeptidase/acylaminoacyl peptidase